MLSQCGQDAVSFGFRSSFILPPQDGHTKIVRRFTFCTTTGFVRAWLKLWRGSNSIDIKFSHLTSDGVIATNTDPAADNSAGRFVE